MVKDMIGIIGGSGLYKMDGVHVVEERHVATPFGDPSDAVIIGRLDGRDVAFLPRHGRGHKIPPHKINYRANIFAMKSVGVSRIISVSAVGSMKENIHPGELVMVNQFIDRTKSRVETFYDDGIAVHVSFADPVCPVLQRAAVAAARAEGIKVHDGGAYVCIEGPAFSSRAESKLYRSWDVDVIGMTNYQEAKLAREAEICYTTIALATDYDCWHKEEGPVDVGIVIKRVEENSKKAQATIRGMLKTIDESATCGCREALKYAIITDRKAITDETRERLSLLIGRYL